MEIIAMITIMERDIKKMIKNNFWLLKSEPDEWSIDQQKKAGNKGATWDGVRNYQARNNLKKMRNGDLCFFYHLIYRSNYKTIFIKTKVVP